MLEARDRLAESIAPRFAVRFVELRLLQPPQKGPSTDAGRFGSFLDVPLTQEGSDGLFLLASET